MKARLCKIKNSYFVVHVIIFMSYLAFAFISNWSLIIGENLMKYDIWDAEYPLQMLMSDALQHGTLPLWNPLMQFGAPNYAMVGTPVWYPITMIIALIGERPESIAICYVIHIALGGYGMFLLANQEISSGMANCIQDLFVAFSCGLRYCASGIYLCNAEHIMIIISVAWIPYIFYFTRRYIVSLNRIYVMLAGLCAGLMFVGGYPEIFYNTFLYLFIYIIYFESCERRSYSGLIRGGLKFVEVCICTMCACAISLLPFLNNMSLITRGNGLGQVPVSFNYSILLSLLVPNAENIIGGVEPSMINFYIGIITILLMPMVIKQKNRHKMIYGSMILMAFLMCWGTNSFLHTFMYRFFPMYDSFRFPALNRVFIFMFALLLIASALRQILQMEISNDVINVAKTILISLVVILAVIEIFTVLQDTSNSQKASMTIQALFVPTIFAFVYLCILLAAKSQSINKKALMLSIFLAVVSELLTFSLIETPSTVAITTPTTYTYELETRNYIENQINTNKMRNKSIEFAEQARSTSGLNSQAIVFNKTLDEEGYLSFILSNVSEYRQTYNRSIIEQNPVIYFTDNVVGADEWEINEWRNSPDIVPEQIYIETETSNNYNKNVKFQEEVKERIPLTLSEVEDGICVEGKMNTGETKTGRIRLHVGSSGNEIIVKTYFYQEDAVNCIYEGKYNIKKDDEGRYIDIYFPDIQAEYTKLVCDIPNGEKIFSSDLVFTSRNIKDDYIDKIHFDFNNIDICIDAPDNGYVTILQAWHKGWKLYIDGEKSDIALVDGCFMGVPVSQGLHKIELKFRPVDFYVGCGITMVYIIVLIMMIYKYTRSKHSSI